MRVVLDTNVLISATFWNGDSNRILDKIEQNEVEMIISKETLAEFVRVLGYKEIQDKVKDKSLEMKRTVEKIVSISTLVEPHQNFKVIKDDPHDDKFLDCAIEGQTTFIISQDKHLLELKEFKGVKIVTPSEFLKLF